MHKARAFFCASLGILMASALLPAIASAQAPSYLTQWGTQGIAPGQFNLPHGVAVDGGRSVYVTDHLNNRIQKFTSAGTYVTAWGTFGSGSGQFSYPMGVAVDAGGNVYVADQGNHRVQKFNGGGGYVTQWGVYGFGDGQFRSPCGVAADGEGNVYVAEHENPHRIQKFTADGVYLTQWGGSQPFTDPHNYLSVALDAMGRVYVADPKGHRLRVFTNTGTLLSEWLGANETFWSPSGVAVAMNGVVYISIFGDRVQAFTSDGSYLIQWGTLGSGNGQFDNPTGLATDAMGNIYVADKDNHRIQKFGSSPTPTRSTSWGRIKAAYR